MPCTVCFQVERDLRKSRDVFEIEKLKCIQRQTLFTDSASDHINVTAQSMVDENAIFASQMYLIEAEIITDERRQSMKDILQYKSSVESILLARKALEEEEKSRAAEDSELLDAMVETQTFLQASVAYSEYNKYRYLLHSKRVLWLQILEYFTKDIPVELTVHKEPEDDDEDDDRQESDHIIDAKKKESDEGDEAKIPFVSEEQEEPAPQPATEVIPDKKGKKGGPPSKKAPPAKKKQLVDGLNEYVRDVRRSLYCVLYSIRYIGSCCYEY